MAKLCVIWAVQHGFETFVCRNMVTIIALAYAFIMTQVVNSFFVLTIIEIISLAILSL